VLSIRCILSPIDAKIKAISARPHMPIPTVKDSINVKFSNRAMPPPYGPNIGIVSGLNHRPQYLNSMYSIMLNVEDKQITNKFALFNLGFRPFFIGAVLFAVLSMLCWMLIYVFNFHVPLRTLSPLSWHAHEMVFGYSMAVIAGFLLTAVKNWTGIQTLSGSSLLFLFLTWVAARILAFTIG